jgi:predicted enzyme related to lactoylglutathione lyase
VQGLDVPSSCVYNPSALDPNNNETHRGGIFMAKKARSRKTSSKAKTKTRTKAKRKPATRHAAKQSLLGWVTHTELASMDPEATKKWCAKALGWKFRPSFQMPDGEYHLFTYSDKGGGGIRKNSPAEMPGTIPYVQVASVKAAFAKALKAGAEEMMAPEAIMDDLSIAIVRAPGGVPIGLAGPK